MSQIALCPSGSWVGFGGVLLLITTQNESPAFGCINISLNDIISIIRDRKIKHRAPTISGVRINALSDVIVCENEWRKRNRMCCSLKGKPLRRSRWSFHTYGQFGFTVCRSIASLASANRNGLSLASAAESLKLITPAPDVCSLIFFSDPQSIEREDSLPRHRICPYGPDAEADTRSNVPAYN